MCSESFVYTLSTAQPRTLVNYSPSDLLGMSKNSIHQHFRKLQRPRVQKKHNSKKKKKKREKHGMKENPGRRENREELQTVSALTLPTTALNISLSHNVIGYKRGKCIKLFFLHPTVTHTHTHVFVLQH